MATKKNKSQENFKRPFLFGVAICLLFLSMNMPVLNASKTPHYKNDETAIRNNEKPYFKKVEKKALYSWKPKKIDTKTLEAAYVEYKISRQISGDHVGALENFDKNESTIMKHKKYALYKGQDAYGPSSFKKVRAATETKDPQTWIQFQVALDRAYVAEGAY